MAEQNRRSNQTNDEKELYKLSSKDIKTFIAKERRHDELDRLREIKEQSKIWWRTILFCSALNAALLFLALTGHMN